MSSILTDTKKILGIEENYTQFDLDITLHINSVFATLNQLGLGPVDGFAITDKEDQWDSYTTDKRLQALKTYIYLRVRLLFDPPSTSYLVAALNDQVKELEWRLNVERERTGWTDPTLMM